MRAAEAQLIKAEGLARADKFGEAADALNELRTARGATIFLGADKAELIKEILIERRKELWGEGFGLLDIIRTQQAVVRKPYVDGAGNAIPVTVTAPDGSTKTVTAKYHSALKFSDGKPFVPNSPNYIFAIPLAEEQNNPNLNN